MPTYEYACTSCGEHLEVVQSFRDDALAECPACGGRLRKVFGSIGVVFKGSGFYKTDHGSGAVAGSNGHSSENGSAKDEGKAASNGKSESPAASNSASESSSGGSASKETTATGAGKK